MQHDGSKLRGVYNITPTPFCTDGELDEASFKSLADTVVGAGVDGLTILGVMGEADKLSDAERERVIGGMLEAVDGRVQVCAGTTAAGTDQCVALSRRAAALGVQAVMVGPPKLSRSSDSALRRHYMAVAEAVDIPIVVQDHPPSSGVYMTPEFLAELSRGVPNCRWIKLEDEPSPPKITQVRALNPDALIFGGLGGLMFLEELRRGAIGTMTGFGFPEILVDVFQRWQNGDAEGAAEIFYRYTPLIRFEVQQRLSLAVRKQIYHLRGALACPRAREPYMPLDEGTIGDLLGLLAHLHLLEVA